MKPLTREWIDKAEGDWDSAGLLFRARKRPNYASACFHAQQCIEKYLKARLVEAGIYFSKTHNLIALLSLVVAIEPSWSALQSHLQRLNVYGIDYRYPGSSASKPDAKGAIQDCREVRRAVRQAFGLKP
ncbi:MAG TPA: HEPN domain-containing protein [Blastocatellia bacterium]|nr:HEPN domain-containing protein [Blastocatellia bacterium]